MNRRRWVLAFLAGCIALAIWRTWAYGTRSSGMDFYQYWVIGQLLPVPDNINIYSQDFGRRAGKRLYEIAQEGNSLRFRTASHQRQELKISQTPFLNSLFRIFSTGQYDRDLFIFQLLSLSCYGFALYMFASVYRIPILFGAAISAVLLYAFEPLRSDIRVFNLNQIQLGLLAAFLWVEKRPWGALRYGICGSLLGFSIMAKPVHLFVAAYLAMAWIYNGKYRKTVVAAGGFALAVGIALFTSIWVFGSSQCWEQWFTSVIQIPVDWIPISIGNFSFVRLIYEILHLKSSIFLVALMTALMGWTLSRDRRTAKDDDDLRMDALIISAGSLAYLLSAPLVWIHYFIGTVPAILAILRPAWDKPYILGWAILLIFCMIGPLNFMYGDIVTYPACILFVLSTGALYGLLLREIRLNQGERV